MFSLFLWSLSYYWVMSPCISRFSWQYERFCQYPHIPIPSLETGPSTWKMNHAPKTWKPETPKSALHAFLNMSGCSGSVFLWIEKICFKTQSNIKYIFTPTKKNKLPGNQNLTLFFFLPHKAMPLVPAPHQTVARLLHLPVIRWNLLPPADAEDLEAARDSRRRPPGASCGYIWEKGGRSPGFWQAKTGEVRVIHQKNIYENWKWFDSICFFSRNHLWLASWVS